MPRFTIVAHDHPIDHWDLFLEAGPALRTWRLIPRLEPGVPAVVEPTPDHRLAYLDYEGPVSDNRGTVKQIDTGLFTWICDEADQVAMQLAGSSFVGRLVIARSGERWQATFTPGDP